MVIHIKIDLPWLRKYVKYVEEELLEKYVPAPPEYPEHTYAPIKEFVFRGGKRLRPVITLLSTEAMGEKKEISNLDAAIIEMFHNFALMHDDIEDRSKLRRGKPTLHEMYGIPWALNVGDAFYTYIWGLVAERPDFHRKTYYETFKKVMEGQGLDIYMETFQVWDSLEEKHYFEMVEGKTGALAGHCAGIGAYNATGDEELYWKFYSVFKKAGIAFQIRDDVLNLTGGEEYGKKIGSDITEGARTLIVIHALKNLPTHEALALRKILISHTTDPVLINYAISLIKKAGSIDYAQKVAEKYAEEAMKEWESIPVVNVEKGNLLKELIAYMVGRQK